MNEIVGNVHDGMRMILKKQLERRVRNARNGNPDSVKPVDLYLYEQI